MVAGIYLIKNKINGHMYIGGSMNIKKRFDEHKRGSDSDVQAIDRAILKYGKENFTYQIITELPANWEVIGKHEKYWINFYNTFKNKKHYNLTAGGENPPIHNMKGKNNPFYGHKHTKENKENWSKQRRGKKHPLAKYTLWNNLKTKYSKRDMLKNNGGDKPRKVFSLKFNGKLVHINQTFYDFTTPEIIHDLICEAIGDYNE